MPAVILRRRWYDRVELGGVTCHLDGMNALIPSFPARWRSFVLVCGKCSRKLDGGFGKKRKHALNEALRGALKAAGRRELRVVNTGCLGLCPKRAVTIAWAGKPGELMAVPEGTDPESVLARLEV